MRYHYTEQGKESVVTNFMKNNKVTKVPAKEKKKYILLAEFITRIEQGKIYTEKEINAELLKVYPTGEYVEQRRYLITFNFFKRSSDGNQYWLNI